MWPCTGSVSGWVERGHARGCPNFDGQEPLRGIQRSTPPWVELAVHVRHHSQRRSRTAAAARMTRNVAGADHGTADALAGRGRPSSPPCSRTCAPTQRGFGPPATSSGTQGTPPSAQQVQRRLDAGSVDALVDGYLGGRPLEVGRRVRNSAAEGQRTPGWSLARGRWGVLS